MADADGQLSVVRPSEVTAIGPRVDLAELPLVLEDGAPVAEVERRSLPAPRGALCLRADGALVVARGTVGSDAPLAEALLKNGCKRGVLLDRGARTPPFYHRAGTSSPPRGRTDDTALYVLAAPMKPRAFRFEATVAKEVAQVAPRK
jgi:hypothetical protein